MLLSVFRQKSIYLGHFKHVIEAILFTCFFHRVFKVNINIKCIWNKPSDYANFYQHYRTGKLNGGLFVRNSIFEKCLNRKKVSNWAPKHVLSSTNKILNQQKQQKCRQFISKVKKIAVTIVQYMYLLLLSLLKKAPLTYS